MPQIQGTQCLHDELCAQQPVLCRAAQRGKDCRTHPHPAFGPRHGNRLCALAQAHQANQRRTQPLWHSCRFLSRGTLCQGQGGQAEQVDWRRVQGDGGDQCLRNGN